MEQIKRIIIVYILAFSTLFAEETLTIGTKNAPPFAMKNAKGDWIGVSIDLWREVANQLNLDYKFKEYDLNGLLNDIKNKKIDIGLAAITVTANREKFADFSNSYYTEELSIAIPKNEGTIFYVILDKIFSYVTLFVLIGLMVIIFIAGLAFWLMEKSERKEKSSATNLRDGIWWAAVTMTTVGYGDITPKTFGGRVVAIIWMFISMFLVAILIASFASLFTTTQKEYFITTAKDLSKGKIATVKGSFSDEYLKKRDIFLVYYDTLKDALEAVKNKEVDAVVYDRQLLLYLIDKHYNKSLKLTKAHFMPQGYSFILKENCHLREPLNRVLLEILESDKWKEIKRKYSVD